MAISPIVVWLLVTLSLCSCLSPSGPATAKPLRHDVQRRPPGGEVGRSTVYPCRIKEPPSSPWPPSNLEEASSRRDFLAASAITTATILTYGLEDAHAQDTAASFVAPTSSNEETRIDWAAIFEKSKKKALGGGKAGASAAVVQVLALMWLRTSMNYQYRYGGSLQEALTKLWEQGGLSRLYQGLPFALLQGPATRFGDTAANTGILTLLDALPATQGLPLPVKTACGSATAGLWRIVLMPIDTSKTAMQVEGSGGFTQLWSCVLTSGPGPLYRGALAQAAATAVGHFPWFITYNALNENIPTAENDLFLALIRSAGLGLVSSCVSDCTSNSLRVIKTTKQTAQLSASSDKDLSYQEIISSIVEQDGIGGLFFRGLSTRLLINAIQGAAFSVLWRYFQQVGS